jgi:septation ring formation regulator EzrA
VRGVTRVLLGIRGRLRRRLRRAGGYDELAKRVKKVESAQARQREKLARLQERAGRTKERVDEVNLTAFRANSSYEILTAQVGAMEERLQDLAEKLDTGPLDMDDADTVSARSLIEEIREEHRRIRVRFGTMTQYEERIRRLESALAEEIAAAAELAHEAAEHGALLDAPTHGAVDLPDDQLPVTKS